tara:strand:+ start:965 stop:1186 length:222 start_codon:yes stop_codon:yes gene_type:complete
LRCCSGETGQTSQKREGGQEVNPFISLGGTIIFYMAGVILVPWFVYALVALTEPLFFFGIVGGLVYLVFKPSS